MTEVNYILTTMTDRSLIIIDELCRSTSVEEGTGIAMMICDKLARSKAYTFITTHFTLLTKFADLFFNIKVWQLETIPRGDPNNPKTMKLDFKFSLASGATTLRGYGIYMVRDIWPPEVMSHVDELQERYTKKSKDPKFLRLQPRVRLRYDLHCKVLKLKLRKVLTLANLNTLLQDYNLEMEKIGGEDVQYSQNILQQFHASADEGSPILDHSIFDAQEMEEPSREEISQMFLENLTQAPESESCSSTVENKTEQIEENEKIMFSPLGSQDTDQTSITSPSKAKARMLEIFTPDTNLDVSQSTMHTIDFTSQNFEPEVLLSYSNSQCSLNFTQEALQLNETEQRPDTMRQNEDEHFYGFMSTMRQAPLTPFKLPPNAPPVTESSFENAFARPLQDDSRKTSTPLITHNARNFAPSSTTPSIVSERCQEVTRVSTPKISFTIPRNAVGLDIASVAEDLESFAEEIEMEGIVSEECHQGEIRQEKTNKHPHLFPVVKVVQGPDWPSSSEEDIHCPPSGPKSLDVDIEESNPKSVEEPPEVIESLAQREQHPVSLCKENANLMIEAFNSLSNKNVIAVKVEDEETNHEVAGTEGRDSDIRILTNKSNNENRNDSSAQIKYKDLKNIRKENFPTRNVRCLVDNKLESIGEGSQRETEPDIMEQSFGKYFQNFTKEPTGGIGSHNMNLKTIDGPANVKKSQNQTPVGSCRNKDMITVNDTKIRNEDITVEENNKEKSQKNQEANKQKSRAEIVEMRIISSSNPMKGTNGATVDPKSSNNNLECEPQKDVGMKNILTKATIQKKPSVITTIAVQNSQVINEETGRKEREKMDKHTNQETEKNIHNDNNDETNNKAQLKHSELLLNSNKQDCEERLNKDGDRLLEDSNGDIYETADSSGGMSYSPLVPSVQENEADSSPGMYKTPISFHDPSTLRDPETKNMNPQTNCNNEKTSEIIEMIRESSINNDQNTADFLTCDDESGNKENVDKSYDINYERSTEKCSSCESLKVAIERSETEICPEHHYLELPDTGNNEVPVSETAEGELAAKDADDEGVKQLPPENFKEGVEEHQGQNENAVVKNRTKKRKMSGTNKPPQKKMKAAQDKSAYDSSNSGENKEKTVETMSTSEASKLRNLEGDFTSSSSGGKMADAEQTVTTSLSEASRKRNLEKGDNSTSSTNKKSSKGTAKQRKKKQRFKTPLKKKSTSSSGVNAADKSKNGIGSDQSKATFAYPSKLSQKAIREAFREQDKKFFTSSGSSAELARIWEERMKRHARPTPRQIQQAEWLATIRKTNEGVEVIPAEKKTKKPKGALKNILASSSYAVNMNIFSDQNAETFEQFIKSDEKDYKSFNFKFGCDKENKNDGNMFDFKQVKTVSSEYTQNSQSWTFVRKRSAEFNGVSQLSTSTSVPPFWSPPINDFSLTPDGYYKQNKEDINGLLRKYK